MISAPPKLPRSIYSARLGEFPSIAFTDQQAFAHLGHWRDFFTARIGGQFDSRLILEIGCADAAFLSRIAAKHPNTAFIGVDWKCKAVYDAAAHVSSVGLKNVALIRGRAQDIGRIFAPAEADEIWIFHPEPCDRPAELKNRLVNETFLSDVHRALRKPGSALCLKTDHAGYYAHVSELLSRPAIRKQFTVAMNSSNFWCDKAAIDHTASRSFAGETTTYEQRFNKKRAPIYYVELRKR